MSDITNKVRTIIKDVQKNGDRAVSKYIRRYDKVSISAPNFKVKRSLINKSLTRIDKELGKSMKDAAERIKHFHASELKQTAKNWKTIRKGVTTGQKYTPVKNVGIYVPGGRYSYPSTVLMTAIPAKVAGVRNIIMATPPKKLTPEIMAAAKIAGVTEIYRIGGPAAIAAMAYGTRKIPKVDLIVGPGNKWVTEAKRQLFGTVGIDLIAGPSEIVIIADNTANAHYIISDMIAQAEHDPDSKAILISNDKKLINKIGSVTKYLDNTQYKLIPAPSLNKAAEASDAIAPEHLTLMVKNPEKLLSKINNAGAVFLGKWSPVASGDYWAGPSHVLPTGSTARFMSGLSVQTFLKRSGIVQISKKAMKKHAYGISRLASAEGLYKHAHSLCIRKEGNS